MRPPLTVWADRAHSVGENPHSVGGCASHCGGFPSQCGGIPSHCEGVPSQCDARTRHSVGGIAHSVMTLTWSVTLGWYLRPSYVGHEKLPTGEEPTEEPLIGSLSGHLRAQKLGAGTAGSIES